jgi:hypothetical protein
LAAKSLARRLLTGIGPDPCGYSPDAAALCAALAAAPGGGTVVRVASMGQAVAAGPSGDWGDYDYSDPGICTLPG